MDDAEKRLFERSVIAVERLAREVPRLRSDVERLNNRIEPFEDEPDYQPVSYAMPKPKTFRDVLDNFERVRRDVEECESIIRRMGARMEQIRDDAWSRNDMKQWLKGGQRD